jgi:23S rRNA pseudouridine1911/1915/1917 synthase
MKKILINEDSDVRLDIYLAKELEIARNQIKKLFDSKKILVNNDIVKPSYKLKEGDYLTILEGPKTINLEPINLNLEIIYEDNYIIVINKPRGLLIHPSVSNKSISLVNHLIYHTKDLSNLGGVERPGIVHRLDQDTSGLIVIAKDNETHINLVNQFKNRVVKKVYECLCHKPFIEEKGKIDIPIERHQSYIKMTASPTGREALTYFKVLNQNEFYAHLEVNIITGRTHQIRVHLAYINHPLIGDSLYGMKKDSDGQFLHAKELGLFHPKTNEFMTFKVELPNYFKDKLKELKL